MSCKRQAIIVYATIILLFSYPFYVHFKGALEMKHNHFPPKTTQELLVALEPQIVTPGHSPPANTLPPPTSSRIAIFLLIGALLLATGYAKYRSKK